MCVCVCRGSSLVLIVLCPQVRVSADDDDEKEEEEEEEEEAGYIYCSGVQHLSIHMSSIQMRDFALEFNTSLFKCVILLWSSWTSPCCRCF